MRVLPLIFICLLVYTLEPSFTLESAAFADKNYIPDRYTCVGTNINPEMAISGLPKNTKSLALIMEDPDTAFGTFDHWVVWNIPPTQKISENNKAGQTGRNSRKENKYTGPCPPSGVHTYVFTVYALDTMLQLPDSTGKAGLVAAMQHHIIATAQTRGLFHK